MRQFYLQRSQNFATEFATDKLGHKNSSRTVCFPQSAMQVAIPASRRGRWHPSSGRVVDHPSSPGATIQVSSESSYARNLVTSHQNDSFMQPSMNEIRHERDELVGVKPCSITRFSNFEGRMQVELDTVKYAENVINAMMNASPNRDPGINYLLSIVLQFSNRFPWNQESIRIPIYRYNDQTCQ